MDTPSNVMVGYSEQFAKPMQLLLFNEHGREYVCQLAGVSSLDAADKLRDTALYIDRSAVHYVDGYTDPVVIGYAVFDESGSALGTIASVFRTQAHAVWTIMHDERETMIPAVDQFVVSVDHQAKSVVVRPIPGMFDEAVSDEQDNDAE